MLFRSEMWWEYMRWSELCCYTVVVVVVAVVVVFSAALK